MSHPINELFALYPNYPAPWIEYAFLRWCHPLGALAWTPGLEKAKRRDPDWVDWLERGCWQFLLGLGKNEPEHIEHVKKQLAIFMEAHTL